MFCAAHDARQKSVVDDARLSELITSTVAPDMFADGKFTAEYIEGQQVLYVRADKPTQDKVSNLINELRRHVGHDLVRRVAPGAVVDEHDRAHETTLEPKRLCARRASR